MIFLYLVIYLLCLFIFLFFIAIILFQLTAIFTTDAPFVPVPNIVEESIIKALNLNDSSVLYDLGCGDARVLIKAAEMNQKIKAVGVERAFIPYWLAKFKARRFKNIEIRREDIFKSSFGDATHFFLYLYPGVITKLFPMIKGQCHPGIKIVSCDFQIRDEKPERIIDLRYINPKSPLGKKLFIYSI